MHNYMWKEPHLKPKTTGSISGIGTTIQPSTKMFSFKQLMKDAGDIKQTFISIKARNDPLRVQVYNQYLKMAPQNQERLMSAFDIQQGKMLMSHFKSKVPKP